MATQPTPSSAAVGHSDADTSLMTVAPSATAARAVEALRVSIEIGSVMMWTGLPQLLVIPLIPTIVKYVAPRVMCAFGLGLIALSCVANSFLSPDFAGEQLTHTLVIRSIGQPFVMVGPRDNSGPLEPFAQAAREEALLALAVQPAA